MTQRSYAISCENCPDDTLTGNYSVNAHDAAKNYIGLYLPGYALASCRFVKVQETEKHGLHSLWKAEAYNQDQSRGVALFVRELSTS